MPDRNFGSFDRRDLLKLSAGVLVGGGLANVLRAEDRPLVVNPRATSGDAVAEPDWEERLTISVGQKEAQIVGSTEKALQAAVDAVARFGGGTVRILPGTYRLR